MKNIVQFPNYGAIKENAANWLAKMDAGELSAAEQDQLADWLEADPIHRKTLINLADTWENLDVLAVLAGMFPLHENQAYATQPENTITLWGKISQSQLTPFAIANACLVLVLSIVLFYPQNEENNILDNKSVELVQQTPLGKQSHTVLPDGSTMTLNTQSKVNIRFSDVERAVYLSSGEAYFDIEKNPELPFVVYAGSGKVQAVGTAFSVRINRQAIDVMVSEGVVQVATDGNDTNSAVTDSVQSITLKQGGIARYSDSIEEFSYIGDEDIDRALAWTRGKWFFDGEPLSRVIEEANRYTRQQIVISDNSIANMQIGGYFNVGDVEPLLRALESGFDLKVSYLDDDKVQLSASEKN